MSLQRVARTRLYVWITCALTVPGDCTVHHVQKEQAGEEERLIGQSPGGGASALRGGRAVSPIAHRKEPDTRTKRAGHC